MIFEHTLLKLSKTIDIMNRNKQTIAYILIVFIIFVSLPFDMLPVDTLWTASVFILQLLEVHSYWLLQLLHCFVLIHDVDADDRAIHRDRYTRSWASVIHQKVIKN